MTVVDFLRRALQLLLDFSDSLRDRTRPGAVDVTGPAAGVDGSGAGGCSAALRRWWWTSTGRRRRELADQSSTTSTTCSTTRLARATGGVAAVVPGHRDRARADRRRPGHRSARVSAPSTTRTSATGSFATAPIRMSLDFPLVRGLYDLVFGYEDADPEPAGGRRRPGCLPHRHGPLRVQGRDLLEDDRRHGRRRDRSPVPGTAQARRAVRVLPPRRCAAPRCETAGRRCDHDGPAGATLRRRRPLRTVDHASAVFLSFRPRRSPIRSTPATGSTTSNRISASATTSRRGFCAAASTSITSCSPCPSA